MKAVLGRGRPAALASLVLLTGCAATTVGLASGTGAATNPAALPIGDGKVSTTAARNGWVFACSTPAGGGGAFRDGPWIKSDGTWDSTTKATVDGSVHWNGRVSFRVSGGRLKITGNGLPTSGTTGTFPVSSSDDAYGYDRNPNSIAGRSVSVSLPANPKVGTPKCTSLGAIGITRTGVAIFNALDGMGRDAAAHEVQDSCDGHPERSSTYHYHSISSCLTHGDSRQRHSGLIGYIFDGFPIYGPRGSGGKLLSPSDLDVCNGHTHRVRLRGKLRTTYHYHATLAYPYTIGCFRGTPVSSGTGGGGGRPQAPPQGPPPGG